MLTCSVHMVNSCVHSIVDVWTNVWTNVNVLGSAVTYECEPIMAVTKKVPRLVAAAYRSLLL